MSRIGNKHIQVPNSVSIDIKYKNFISVKGSKGQLQKQFNPKLNIIFENGIVRVVRPNNELFMKKIHGTTRALLFNMIKGVEDGFTKRLELVGLDYKSELQGDKLVLYLGFSHLIKINIPENITLEMDLKNKYIYIKGIDKQFVGEFAAKILRLKKPEPYKGKGISYEGQYIIRKAGKSAKK